MTMKLLPIGKDLLARPASPTSARPALPMADFGIAFPKKDEKRRDLERGLTSEECITMFGKVEAVEMNFIPQMLTALALEQAEEFINYCRDHRLSDFKKHNREMRKCIDKYRRDLRISYGRAYGSYELYLGRLRERVEVDLFKSWCSYLNEASRQYVGHEHNEIPARVTFVRMLLTFVEDFDKNMDRAIGARLNTVCRRKPDPMITLVSILCLDIALTFGARVKITDVMTRCVRVLATRCREVVREIISEEEAGEAK